MCKKCDTNSSEASMRFMREAIALSEANVRAGGGPFGAVIVKDGVVVATGTNGVTRENDQIGRAHV